MQNRCQMASRKLFEYRPRVVPCDQLDAAAACAAKEVALAEAALLLRLGRHPNIASRRIVGL